MDEATSALDSETEREIQDALESAGKGRTVISIAHRLSTVSNAEKIIVVEGGSILEAGTHANLIENRNRYFELWNIQLKSA